MSSMTPTLGDLLDRLWRDYIKLNPHAIKVHQLLESRGERVENDHIALRTFDDPRVNIDRLSTVFVHFGYHARDQYQFPEKKLRARHYEHSDPVMPRIFISELKLAECSQKLRGIVNGLIDQVNVKATMQWDFCVCGRPWSTTLAEYDALAGESEYAGWLAAFGFRANHFTVSVNSLTTLKNLQVLNELLKANGFVLNSSGGEVKGSPVELLEQSSTLADKVQVQFADGVRMVPACYYEFARRYPGPDGKLFQGFVAKSADKIFESTDRR